MATFHLALDGYKSKTVAYKSTPDGTATNLEVFYPDATTASDEPRVVLLHYHGGFLVVGDRYAFFPHWLVRACAARGWIFVSPEYRLMPESTAHESVEDASDAYQWVLSILPQELGCRLGPVLMAGTSAGAYLALATAASSPVQPAALLLIYGMLDATTSRYTTPGTGIFGGGGPPLDTSLILKAYPVAKPGDSRLAVSAAPLPANPTQEPRFGLVAALHLEALFLDYMTGVEGLGRSVAAKGAEAIPEEHRNLFPVAFAKLAHLPQTMLLHGKGDTAVPVEQSIHSAEKLRADGVNVVLELPEDVDHGFDARGGDVDIESVEGEKVPAYQSLRKVIAFLDRSVASA